jgi:aspartate-semialdehyde dehydrogenase
LLDNEFYIKIRFLLLSEFVLKIAVLGASGVVGQAMLATVAKRLPNARVSGFASTKKNILINNLPVKIDCIDDIDFTSFDVVLSALPANVAREVLPQAVKENCFVVDNSSAFRDDVRYPLVVPEVNANLVNNATRLVASPNCVAIPLSMALKALHEKYILNVVNVSTYQSVSGAGNAAMAELNESAQAKLEGKVAINKNFVAPIGFNVVPYIDTLEENFYTKEEMKIYNETKKIINFKDFNLNVTAVRVPVVTGHAMSVNCQFENKVTRDEAVSVLQSFKGIKVVDDFLTPLTHGVDSEVVYISRVRCDLFNDCGLNFWLVADNILKGAALNTVQIVEHWLQTVDILEESL